MKLKKIIVSILASFLIFPTLVGTTTVSASTSTDNIQEIIPRKAIITWRYKTINGKLYMRQYNNSTEKWIGSWELAK